METVNYSVYEEQIRRLVDKQVIGKEVREPEGVYLVHQLGMAEDPGSWPEEKTRNETDLILTRLRRTIEQDLADDPYAQKVFADLLKQAIAEAEAMFDHPLKQYALFKDHAKPLGQLFTEWTVDPESAARARTARSRRLCDRARALPSPAPRSWPSFLSAVEPVRTELEKCKDAFGSLRRGPIF